MQRNNVYTLSFAVGVLVMVFASAAGAAPVTLDFETDQFGASLGNGQIIDTEFTTPVAITSPDTGISHLGPTIFDSAPGGLNAASLDQDLLVDLGNILILQDTAYPDSDGSFFTEPNDEADFNPQGTGTVVFSFANPVELLSIDLIDIDAGVGLLVVLEDSVGALRTYQVPPMWTNDVVVAPVGWDTLDLTDLNDQVGEGGSIATGLDTGAFNPLDAVSLSVTFSGTSPSGAIDNVVYVPEPATLLLLGGGLLFTLRRKH